MIKQGLDYDNNVSFGRFFSPIVLTSGNINNMFLPKGEYVRLWVPELQRIMGADVHTPWTLSSAMLSHAHVSLGETYPTPIIVAPEWSRYFNKKLVSA